MVHQTSCRKYLCTYRGTANVHACQYYNILCTYLTNDVLGRRPAIQLARELHPNHLGALKLPGEVCAQTSKTAVAHSCKQRQAVRATSVTKVLEWLQEVAATPGGGKLHQLHFACEVWHLVSHTDSRHQTGTMAILSHATVMSRYCCI